jgi:protein-S-isoprenylcysteine O-methyltransferase Ste14
MNEQKTLISIVFVVIQFICLGLIGVTGSLIPSNRVLLLIEVFGIGLGIWAILTMRIGNFNITPDPLKWSRLVTSGPYHYIRHPMYLALLLTTLPLIISDFDLFRFTIWVILLIDLLLKLNYEEKLLASSLVGYDQYVRQSARLIPFIY